MLIIYLINNFNVNNSYIHFKFIFLFKNKWNYTIIYNYYRHK